MDESSYSPSFFAWAPGHDWQHQETDHSRIERFVVGVQGVDEESEPLFDLRSIDPSRLVVHAVERERFQREQQFGGASLKADQSGWTRQRRTLLTIIAALCKNIGLDHNQRGASQRITEMTDGLGVHVDDETIRSLLKDIPDALERCMGDG